MKKLCVNYDRYRHGYNYDVFHIAYIFRDGVTGKVVGGSYEIRRRIRIARYAGLFVPLLMAAIATIISKSEFVFLISFGFALSFGLSLAFGRPPFLRENYKRDLKRRYPNAQLFDVYKCSFCGVEWSEPEGERGPGDVLGMIDTG